MSWHRKSSMHSILPSHFHFLCFSHCCHHHERAPTVQADTACSLWGGVGGLLTHSKDRPVSQHRVSPGAKWKSTGPLHLVATASCRISNQFYSELEWSPMTYSPAAFNISRLLTTNLALYFIIFHPFGTKTWQWLQWNRPCSAKKKKKVREVTFYSCSFWAKLIVQKR